MFNHSKQVEHEILKNAVNSLYNTLINANYSASEEFKLKGAVLISYSNPKLANAKGMTVALEKAKTAFEPVFNQAVMFLASKEQANVGDYQSAKDIIQSILIKQPTLNLKN